MLGVHGLRSWYPFHPMVVEGQTVKIEKNDKQNEFGKSLRPRVCGAPSFHLPGFSFLAMDFIDLN